VRRRPEGGLYESLERGQIPINRRDGVGGGIAASRRSDAGQCGKKVYCEREPTIGGHMAQFDKTFPHWTARLHPDPRVSVKTQEHHALDYSEVTQVDGYVGNYKVKVKRLPRYVQRTCAGCWNVSSRVCSRRPRSG